MSILFKILSLLACPNCYNVSSLKLTNVANKKKGLYRHLKVYCDDCTFVHRFYTFHLVRSINDIPRGWNTIKINARADSGTCSIRINFSFLSKLCGFLKMLPTMTQTCYNKMSNIFKADSKRVAEKSISDAAACIKLLMLVYQSMVRGTKKDFQQLVV